MESRIACRPIGSEPGNAQERFTISSGVLWAVCAYQYEVIPHQNKHPHKDQSLILIFRNAREYCSSSQIVSHLPTFYEWVWVRALLSWKLAMTGKIRIGWLAGCTRGERSSWRVTTGDGNLGEDESEIVNCGWRSNPSSRLNLLHTHTQPNKTDAKLHTSSILCFA